MSLEDRMTDMKNRKSFEMYLEEIQEGAILLENVLLLFVKIAELKKINDMSGRQMGDETVIRTARSIQSAERSVLEQQAVSFRVEGDEFAIIMVDMNSELNYTISDKINEINRQLAISKDGEPTVSISVGIALSDRENPGEDIFRDADKALYQTKERGRNGYTFY